MLTETPATMLRCPTREAQRRGTAIGSTAAPVHFRWLLLCFVVCSVLSAVCCVLAQRGQLGPRCTVRNREKPKTGPNFPKQFCGS